MSLTGSLLERAHSAIVSTYDRAELRRFVHIDLGENFERIVRDDNLDVQAFEVLLWAGRHGRELELFEKLAADREREPAFAEIAAAVRSGAGAAPVGGRSVRLPDGGSVPLQKPPRVEHFTGRDLELARLLADLQPGKVVTLCGPGGMGKTALAAEAVWRLAPHDDPPERFLDGVLFHTFYHQPQVEIALETIARAFGVDPRPNAQQAARLALANRKALLILDGAEAADDLDAVLNVAGSCGVLITTRRHADAPADYQDIEPLPRGESLSLLRSWAGKYAANDDAANDAAANKIVRLLGGLPFALVLVGRYLSQRKQAAGEYAGWLAEAGLDALRFGDRPSRSVPLLLARNLEQVSADTRAAFGVTGVLAFAPFDAEVVAAALDVTMPAAHRVLGELVDYGLLIRPDDLYQVTHALAHSYARTHAAPDGETVERLALIYAAAAEQLSARGPAGFAVLDGERAHIMAVQAAALSAQQWHAVQAIAAQVDNYLDLKGYWTDRLTVLQAGLDAARADGDRYDEMAFANSLGLAHADSGRPRQAIEFYEIVASIAQEIGHRSGEGAALGNLGNAYLTMGETRRAVELYEQRLVIAREIGDRHGEGAALGSLGLAYADLGETRRAVELDEQSLVVMREIGDRRGEGNALGNLGAAYADLGETRRAVEYHEQYLAIAREIGDRRGEGIALGNLAIAYRHLGQTRRAVEYYEQYLAIAREIGDRRGEGVALGNLGLAYFALGETRRAIELYEQALAIRREIGDRRGESNALGNLGSAFHYLGETRRAAELYEQALVIEREIGDRRGEGIVLINLGRALADAGDAEKAAAHCRASLAIKRKTGDRSGEGEALNCLGYAYRASGRYAEAIDLHRQAIDILTAVEAPDSLAEALVDLAETHLACRAFGEAAAQAQAAAQIAAERDWRMRLADAQWAAARAAAGLGDQAQALALAQQALDIYAAAEHPKAAAVREKMGEWVSG